MALEFFTNQRPVFVAEVETESGQLQRRDEKVAVDTGLQVLAQKYEVVAGSTTDNEVSLTSSKTFDRGTIVARESGHRTRLREAVPIK